jgi:hypothetical protein
VVPRKAKHECLAAREVDRRSAHRTRIISWR